MADAEKLSVWDVFEKYADIRDELEDAMETFSSSMEDIQVALMDLDDELEEIRSHLSQCDKVFRRFKARNPKYFE